MPDFYFGGWNKTFPHGSFSRIRLPATIQKARPESLNRQENMVVLKLCGIRLLSYSEGSTAPCDNPHPGSFVFVSHTLNHRHLKGRCVCSRGHLKNLLMPLGLTLKGKPKHHSKGTHLTSQPGTPLLTQPALIRDCRGQIHSHPVCQTGDMLVHGLTSGF